MEARFDVGDKLCICLLKISIAYGLYSIYAFMKTARALQCCAGSYLSCGFAEIEF